MSTVAHKGTITTSAYSRSFCLFYHHSFDISESLLSNITLLILLPSSLYPNNTLIWLMATPRTFVLYRGQCLASPSSKLLEKDVLFSAYSYDANIFTASTAPRMAGFRLDLPCSVLTCGVPRDSNRGSVYAAGAIGEGLQDVPREEMCRSRDSQV